MLRPLLRMVVALVILLPTAVAAQEGLEAEYHKNIKVYQPKPVLLKQRAEIGAFLAGCVNPRTNSDWGYGVTVDYHINELFAIGAQFTYFAQFRLVDASTDTTLKNEIEDKYGLFPENTRLGHATTLRFAYTPLFGKFNAGKMPYWDASIFVGGGIVHSRLSYLTGAVEAGIGLRFFITKGLAIHGEISDMIYWEHFQYETLALQKWMVRLGITLFIPYKFKYGGEK